MDGRKLNVMKEYSNSEIKVIWDPKIMPTLWCMHKNIT